jgi:hypothetical protein
LSAEPAAQILSHPVGDLPGKEMSHVGIDNAGAVGQGAGCGQAAVGGDVAIPLAGHKQYRDANSVQISLAVVAPLQSGAQSLASLGGGVQIGGQGHVRQIPIGRWGLLLHQVAVKGATAKGLDVPFPAGPKPVEQRGNAGVDLIPKIGGGMVAAGAGGTGHQDQTLYPLRQPQSQLQGQDPAQRPAQHQTRLPAQAIQQPLQVL